MGLAMPQNIIACHIVNGKVGFPGGDLMTQT